MSKPEGSPSAVVVSGGKQYRVAPGDRVLVDRLAADPGAAIKVGRVLLFSDGKVVKVGKDAGDLEVEARVIGHSRGPRTESIRYKSKKRVRVHRGGRSHLTALEIIAVGGVGLEKPEAEEAEVAKPKRGRAKAAPKKTVEAKAAPVEEIKAGADAPKKATRRRAKKEESE